MYMRENAVVIACMDIELCDSIRLMFENKGKMKIYCTYGDLKNAFRMIKLKKPCFVFLDNIIFDNNEADLIDIIKNDFGTSYIFVSSSKDDMLEDKLLNLGISKYIKGPFEKDRLEFFFEGISENRKDTVNSKSFSINKNDVADSLEMRITRILRGMGMPANIRGYYFLRESIMLATEDILNSTLVTKDIYPQVANKYKTTSSSVERGVRHAIEVTWKRGNSSVIDEFFVHYAPNRRMKPTNSEFIAQISDYLRLEYDKI